jgi:hypothetical protein
MCELMAVDVRAARRPGGSLIRVLGRGTHGTRGARAPPACGKGTACLIHGDVDSARPLRSTAGMCRSWRGACAAEGSGLRHPCMSARVRASGACRFTRRAPSRSLIGMESAGARPSHVDSLPAYHRVMSGWVLCRRASLRVCRQKPRGLGPKPYGHLQAGSWLGLRQLKPIRHRVDADSLCGRVVWVWAASF